MRRETLIRAADAIEDLMSETAFKETIEERAIWWACLPLWDALRMLLRKCSKENKDAAKTQREEVEKQPCPWCYANGKPLQLHQMDWDVLDDDFGQLLHANQIHYCFSCGREIVTPNREKTK